MIRIVRVVIGENHGNHYRKGPCLKVAIYRHFMRVFTLLRFYTSSIFQQNSKLVCKSLNSVKFVAI